MKEIRVRFAPSPTGPLHIGGVRTALYNYLFAKKHGGTLILRIEDTDQTRFVEGAENYIIESLTWCGITFDEGVHIGGPYAPYRQSDRKALYRQYAEQLVASGHAYYAFDTPEELEMLRKDYESRKEMFQYGPSTRLGLKNSLTLTADETQKLLDSGTHYVIRIKIPQNETITVIDLIRGATNFESSLLDDKVLFKSDGMPTYHLANVVDDYLMKISHVIRGEEWLPSAPLHVLLYKYLGWEEQMPQFSHLPLLLKPDGNGKLSKRDGDRLGFPVFPTEWQDPKSKEISSGYRESGYLPEAFINMLALLGWNPGNDQEILSLHELIDLFSIERCSKSGAKFDPEKAKWFNHQYLSKKTGEELAVFLTKQLAEKGISANQSYITHVCNMVKERCHLLPDLWEQSYFFFQAPKSYDEKVIAKIWKPQTTELLTGLTTVLVGIELFTAPEIEDSVKKYCEEKQVGMGQVMNPLRLTVVGTNAGPSMFEMMELLGQTEVLERLNKGIEEIKV